MSLYEGDTGLKCPHCGYNLTGLTTSRCPECGTPFTLADARTTPGGSPSTPGMAFLKGGIYTVVGFVVLGLACALVGGRFHIDIGGAIMLFVIGGLVALGLRAIYGKGYRQGRSEPADRGYPFDDRPGPPPPPPPPPPAV